VVSIGIFDGVHLGHSSILERVRERSEELGGESVIVTFWPHPRIVLGKDTGELKFLSTLHEKQLLLEKQGIDHLLIIPFTYEFSRIAACDFVKNYLAKTIGMKHLVFGFNHHFGRNREGSYENLKDCAQKYGFSIEQISPVLVNNSQVSSSAIREFLLAGDVEKANELLGYRYFIEGNILGGKQIGRVIGYPTANISVEDPHKLIPADGVYAVEVLIWEQKFPGMMNIGFRPTINHQGEGKSLEVHIMDFEGNVYNHDIHIRFVKKLRNEKHFSGLEDLKMQLKADKAAVLEIFGNK
jgi:riboflavin kinase/FMN adenylyltransferase